MSGWLADAKLSTCIAEELKVAAEGGRAAAVGGGRLAGPLCVGGAPCPGP